MLGGVKQGTVPQLRTRSCRSLRLGGGVRHAQLTEASGPVGQGRACLPFSLQRKPCQPQAERQAWAAAQALNPHAGRPPGLAQPSRLLPPVFSDAVLLSVPPPAWFLLSGTAGAPPAPAISPAECGSWQLRTPDLLLPKDGTIKLSR